MAFGYSWWGRVLDPTTYTKGIMDGAMQTGWKGTRSVFRGARGKRKLTRPDGTQEYRGAFGDAIQDIKNRGRQVFTGKEYDKFGNVIESKTPKTFGEAIDSRLAGGLHLVGDTLSAPLGVIGWGGKQVGRGALIGGVLSARVGAHLTGRITKEGIDFVGDAALGAADLVGAMNKTHHGRLGLFTAGAVGTTVVGGFGTATDALGGKIGSSQAVADGLQFYKGQSIDTVAGSVMPSSYGVDEAGTLVNPTLDSMGADGDLALAMHNMR